MKKRKVFAIIAYSVVGILLAAIIGHAVYQRHQIVELSQGADAGGTEKNGQAGQGPERAESAGEAAYRGVGGTSGENRSELSYQLDAAEEELDVARTELSDELDRKEELKRQMIEQQKNIMNDPAIRKQIQTAYMSQFTDLFEELDLSPEKLEELKAQMMDNQMSIFPINYEVLAASASEEKEAVQNRFDEIRKENGEAVEALLGSEDYEIYMRYEDELISKNYVTRFNESLGAGEKLTIEQERALVTIMYEGQEAVFAELGYDARYVIEFPSDLNDETIAERFKNEEKIHSQSVENASNLLSDSQLEQFEESLRSHREMEKKAIEMTRLQFGN